MIPVSSVTEGNVVPHARRSRANGICNGPPLCLLLSDCKAWFEHWLLINAVTVHVPYQTGICPGRRLTRTCAEMRYLGIPHARGTAKKDSCSWFCSSVASEERSVTLSSPRLGDDRDGYSRTEDQSQTCERQDWAGHKRQVRDGVLRPSARTLLRSFRAARGDITPIYNT